MREAPGIVTWSVDAPAQVHDAGGMTPARYHFVFAPRGREWFLTMNDGLRARRFDRMPGGEWLAEVAAAMIREYIEGAYQREISAEIERQRRDTPMEATAAELAAWTRAHFEARRG